MQQHCSANEASYFCRHFCGCIFWTRLVCCFPLCFDVLDTEYQMKTIANSFSTKFLWCLYLHNLFTPKVDVKYSYISCASANRQALIYSQYFVFLRFMLLSDSSIVHCIFSPNIETALSILCVHSFWGFKCDVSKCYSIFGHILELQEFRLSLVNNLRRVGCMTNSCLSFLAFSLTLLLIPLCIQLE